MCTIIINSSTIKKLQLGLNPLPLRAAAAANNPDVHVFFAFSALSQKMAAKTESKSKTKE